MRYNTEEAEPGATTETASKYTLAHSVLNNWKKKYLSKEKDGLKTSYKKVWSPYSLDRDSTQTEGITAAFPDNNHSFSSGHFFFWTERIIRPAKPCLSCIKAPGTRTYPAGRLLPALCLILTKPTLSLHFSTKMW